MDVAQVNTEVGEDVDQAAVVEERTNAIRSCVLFDIPEDKSGDASSDSDDEEAGDGVVWPTLEAQAEVY